MEEWMNGWMEEWMNVERVVERRACQYGDLEEALGVPNGVRYPQEFWQNPSPSPRHYVDVTYISILVGST